MLPALEDRSLLDRQGSPMPRTLNATSSGMCPAALGSSSLDYIHFTEEENRGSEQLSDRIPGRMPPIAHALLHRRGGIWRSSVGEESAARQETWV